MLKNCIYETCVFLDCNVVIVSAKLWNENRQQLAHSFNTVKYILACLNRQWREEEENEVVIVESLQQQADPLPLVQTVKQGTGSVLKGR